MDTIIYYSEMEGISLEHLKRSSGYDMRSNHFHNEYEIYFLTEGERLFFFNNRAYQVKKGSLILVDTNLIHMTHAPEDDTTGYESFCILINSKCSSLMKNFRTSILFLFFANTMEFII